MNAHDVLLEAAKLVRKGWCQGVFRDPETDSYCAVGAINHVTPANSRDDEPAKAFLRRVIGSEVIYDWNDDDWRTKGEVIQALEAAAQLALKGKA